MLTSLLRRCVFWLVTQSFLFQKLRDEPEKDVCVEATWLLAHDNLKLNLLCNLVPRVFLAGKKKDSGYESLVTRSWLLICWLDEKNSEFSRSLQQRFSKTVKLDHTGLNLFISCSRCYSMVGRQPGSGAQRISIGNGCGHLGVVAHEIGMEVLHIERVSIGV